jgi:replicative DNA helicase
MTRARDETALDFERTLLASMMLRPADCWRVDVQPEHMSSEQHADVLTAIQSLTQDSKPVDPVSVCDYFETSGKRALGHFAVQLGNVPTTAVPEAFAHRIVAGWRSRKAREIGTELIASADPGAVDAAIAALMSLHATEQKHEFTAKEAARRANEELARAYEAGGKLPGVTTGITDIDEMLGGWHPGDLIVVGGRAAMGKTAFLIGASRIAAKAGIPVGMISGEQPVEQVAQRMISAASKLPAKLLRNPQRFDEAQWSRVTGGITDTAALPIWFLDRSAPTLAEVIRVSRRWVHQHGIKALYVDYLQRIRCEGESRRDEVSAVARGLKNLARDLEIPVIALAQINRAGAGNGVPQLIHLADSDEIGREADIVVMVHREGYYDPSADQGTALVVVEKNRHGATGSVNVAWRAETMTFHDLAHVDPWEAA